MPGSRLPAQLSPPASQIGEYLNNMAYRNKQQQLLIKVFQDIYIRGITYLKLLKLTTSLLEQHILSNASFSSEFCKSRA